MPGIVETVRGGAHRTGHFTGIGPVFAWTLSLTWAHDPWNTPLDGFQGNLICGLI